MGYSRAGNRRCMKVLLRSAYTNFGQPNEDYSFQNNGGVGSLSVALKSKSNFEAGDTIKFRNYLGGLNNFGVSANGSEDIYIGLSTNTTMQGVSTVTVEKEIPLEITFLLDPFNGFQMLVTSATE